MTIKDLKYDKINSLNLLCLIIKKLNRYFEEINKSKYLVLAPTSECKDEKLHSKIRDLITFITKNSNDYDKKYMKIKFNLDGELLLNKTIGIPSMVIVVRAVFHENNTYYPQVFLDECLYKL